MEPCPHCLAGNTTVEISGLRFHTFADRWISCTAVQEQKAIVPVRGEIASLAQSAFQSICVSNFIRLRRRMYSSENL
jgi:hypothetical protein